MTPASVCLHLPVPKICDFFRSYTVGLGRNGGM